MWGLLPGTRLPNLKFVPSAVLEILAFNAPKLRGHVTVTTPTFQKYLSGVMWELFPGTNPGNTPAKFEVRIFSRFGAISI